MISQVGSIVILRNIIFKNDGFVKKHVIDHAFYHGRPALEICETDEKIYYLLLTHAHSDIFDIYDCPMPSDVCGIVNSYVKMNEIHSRPVCFREEKNYVTDEFLLEVLQKLCLAQENYFHDEEYDEIKDLLYLKIKELSCENEKCLKKEKK